MTSNSPDDRWWLLEAARMFRWGKVEAIVDEVGDVRRPSPLVVAWRPWRAQYPPRRAWTSQPSTLHLRPPPCRTHFLRLWACLVHPSWVQIAFEDLPPCLEQYSPMRAFSWHSSYVHFFLPPWRTHRLRAYT
ncbi:hypothetical protein H257_09375 [Aphanomyces astaci]|uniref:Uncharacterized protein n=1 Tax=Aphanomyces astaci TaxID=112090 RepID=W4GDC6_APHAT|nr:hypothetical protein H257_09375 [Aphanomyces astaci]ETV76968.1 hypothetical protein H257_09375 [Aphanomyces astaci]|eukprot:XP_009833880.1 hypothetical protein H257_09375 [Aphanomyces astaci]